MIDQQLCEVLESTGYLADGQPAHGVRIGNDVHVEDRTRSFRPDALWKGDSALTVYFKSEPKFPPASRSPDGIGKSGIRVSRRCCGWFRRRKSISTTALAGLADREPRRTPAANLERIESKLEELDAFAGRLAMETGRFWQEPRARKVDRKTSVDRQLLSDLAALERDLVKADMSRPDAQGLIDDRFSPSTSSIVGSSPRGILPAFTVTTPWRPCCATATPRSGCSTGFGKSSTATCSRPRAIRTARRSPSSGRGLPRGRGPRYRTNDVLSVPVRRDTGGVDQFDLRTVRPIGPAGPRDERSAKSDSSARDDHHGTDVFYTRLPLVSLVLDEITDGLTGKETVLDLTCGSGVFLVEALRRLVRLRSGDAKPNRD